MQNYQEEYIRQFNEALGIPVVLLNPPRNHYLVNANCTAWDQLNKVIGIIDAVFGFEGTCGLVHAMPCLVEKICVTFEAERAFVTYGGVWDIVRDAEVFGGASKEEYVEKNLRSDGVLDSNGGNCHAWITLDSGEIIDFTFASTLFGLDPDGGVKIVHGPALQANRFKYRPYAVGYHSPKLDATATDVKIVQAILAASGWEQHMRQMLVPYLQSVKENDKVAWSKICNYFRTKNPNLPPLE